MGKSNKFDYSNRSSVGKKLGEIIGNALQKESDKVKKDAEKHAQKSRKLSGADGELCRGNVAPTVHTLELRAPNKSLGDDGFCALVDGMGIALRSCSDSAYLVLEDLNLANNNLTIATVARLAPVIEMAKCDLKTLDLSGNLIKVETDEEASLWELFLKSFQNCLKLRRLDLSGNTSLGPRAIEIFARVHCYETPITPISVRGERAVLGLISESESGRPSEDTNDSLLAPGDPETRRTGLRSLPYISFSDVGLTNAGALWLSFLLENHHFPVQLIDGLNPSSTDSSVKQHLQDAESSGIEWQSNRGLGKDGAFVLRKTEELRRQTMLDTNNTGTGFESLDGNDDIEEENTRRKSVDAKTSVKSAPKRRRPSLRSVRTAGGGEHEVTELESMRMKLQRHTILDNGAHSVELWRASLHLFVVSRLILFISPSSSTLYTGDPLFSTPKPSDLVSCTNSSQPTPANSPVKPSPSKKGKESIASVRMPDLSSSYASRLITSKPSPASPFTDTTNFPRLIPIDKPSRPKTLPGKKGKSLPLKPSPLSISSTPSSDQNSSSRYIAYQTQRLSRLPQDQFRNATLPAHLPAQIVLQITKLVHPEHSKLLDVMSDKQIRTVLERSHERNSLAKEREWSGMAESAQVWMLLNSVDCLAYED